jgi:molecular chaperone GrpE
MTPKTRVRMHKLNELRDKTPKSKHSNHPTNLNMTNSNSTNNSNGTAQALKQNIQNKAKKDDKNNNVQVDVAVLDTKIKELEDQIKDWKDKAIRFAADNQNIQKQNEMDNQIIAKKTKKNVMNLVLPFLTSLNLAFTFQPKTDDQAVLKFIATLKSSFEKLIVDLPNVGVEVIVPKINDIFDPKVHTSLNAFEGDEARIKQVVGLGLMIDNQVIQAATVML